MTNFNTPSRIISIWLPLLLGACSSGAGAGDARFPEAGAGDGGAADTVAWRCDPGAALLARVDPSRMLKDLQFLTGLKERKSHASQTRAAAYIRGELGKLSGLTVREQRYTLSGQQWVNLEATIEGQERPDEVIMAGAHYDSTSRDSSLAPGADDDGSGVATILETARVLSGCRPRRQVRLLFFSNEEIGTVGSKQYVAQLKTTLPPSKLLGFISVDMVAYGKDDEDLDLATRTQYGAFVDQAAAAVEKHTAVDVKKIISDQCG
jgi:hypothetical protein